jgi:ATP-dependent Lon protease
MIGATTREPDDIEPAIRSRCAEVFFEPLTEAQIREIVTGAATRLGARVTKGVADTIASYTIEGRKAVQILADAHGQALYRLGRTTGVRITEVDVEHVIQASRLVPHTPVRARSVREVGKTFGLGVSHHVGSLIEIEAAAFPGEKRKGGVRFNETAGSMARDSVFNAASAIRSLTGIDPADSDLHVNIVGGGNIDGPSAGLAIFLALYSALTRTTLPQDVAMTGELSIAGKVRPVGGIVEKLYAARQAGMRAVLIPRENAREARAHVGGLEVIPVLSVDTALDALGIERPRAPRRAAPR